MTEINCPPWIPQKAVSWLIPIPHPGLGEDPVLLFRLPGGWQACSDKPFCRSLGNGQAAIPPQSSHVGVYMSSGYFSIPR